MVRLFPCKYKMLLSLLQIHITFFSNLCVSYPREPEADLKETKQTGEMVVSLCAFLYFLVKKMLPLALQQRLSTMTTTTETLYSHFT